MHLRDGLDVQTFHSTPEMNDVWTWHKSFGIDDVQAAKNHAVRLREKGYRVRIVRSTTVFTIIEEDARK